MVCSLFNYGVGLGIADVQAIIPASSYSPYVNIGDVYQYEGGVACAERFYYSVNDLSSAIVYVTSADGLSYSDFSFSSFPYKTVVQTSTLTQDGEEYSFTGAEVLGVTAAGSGTGANIALTSSDSSLGSVTGAKIALTATSSALSSLITSQASSESLSESLSDSLSKISSTLPKRSSALGSTSSTSTGKSTPKKSSVVSTTTGASVSESITNTKVSSSEIISSTQSNAGIYKVVPAAPLVLGAALMLL